ncbi:MAG: DUF2339 domain-containing protein, partial [Alphaproteobacteria bacterium]|nr:DUF2339 domain-containing protein [Alphaproteobacteria bacterium]
AVWGWQILALLSGGHIVTVHLIALNPLLFGGAVGSYWIFNLLLLAYAVPAVFAIIFHVETTRQNHPSGPVIAGLSALVLAFVWISLEVRHAFHGSWLSRGWTTDAEWYTYSGVWLLYGAVLLALGIWRDSKAVRSASIAVLLISISKVFLFDMSEIGGIYRVISLFFLGLILIALALGYTRFAKRGKEPAGEAEAEGVEYRPDWPR